LRIAFVIHRYGPEITGGAEHQCRLVAEHLAAQHDVDVVTTCARDANTWKNEYPEGPDRIRGVTVRRFRNAHTRNPEAFHRSSAGVFGRSHTRADELEWLKQLGPWSPGLIDYLRKTQQQYDVLVFFAYQYATTVLGLEICPKRSILVPGVPVGPGDPVDPGDPGNNAERAIQLDIYRDVFSRPAAILYNTESERRYVQGDFGDRPSIEDVVGIGVDIPQNNPYPRMPPPADDDAASGDDAQEAAPGAEEEPARGFPSHLLARGAVFRRRHRLHGPLLLYVGRIDPGQGCEELFEYFSSCIEQGGEASLALLGVKLMPVPEDAHIRFAGLLMSGRERLQAFEAATVVACPSAHDGLSLSALEALSVGTPILANARNQVLVEHCVASNGGLYYADQDEFVACLRLLLNDAGLRAAMGRNGREYVRRNYRWEAVLGKYERVLAKVRNAK
jgi:glycosyltransferase involved in cell wall biosynthesis